MTSNERDVSRIADPNADGLAEEISDADLEKVAGGLSQTTAAAAGPTSLQRLNSQYITYIDPGDEAHRVNEGAIQTDPLKR